MIKFPEDIFYECTCCGDCCSRNWRIDVEDEKIESIENLARKHGISEPVVVEPVSKNRALRIIPKKGCIFLTEKNHCIMHMELGPAAKLSMCQTFPFKPIQTPSGHFIRVSFACTAVRKNKGRLVGDYLNDVERYIAQGVCAGDLSFPVSFHDGVNIDESTLLYLNEKVILKKLKEAGINKTYLFEIWNHIWLMLKYALENGASAISREIIDKAIEKNTVIDFDSQASSIKRNMYLAIFIGYEFVGREEKSAFTKLKNLINLVRNKGDLNSKYGKLKLIEIEKVRFIEDNPEINSFLCRYFKHLLEANWLLIRSKDIAWTPTVINSWALVTLFYSLIIWFAKMFAYLRKSGEVALSDVDKAMAIVEVDYVSHILRKWLFLDKQIFAQIFEHLTNKPNFVPTILMD